MIRYLHSADSIRPRLKALADCWLKARVTRAEYAWEFYGQFTNLDDCGSVSSESLEDLLDAVHGLPSEVKLALKEILDRRVREEFQPMQGLGIRITVQEQVERLPFVERATEGLLFRLQIV